MINLRLPINQLGYGIVGFNILKSLAHNTDICYFPIGNPECPNEYHELITKTIQNQDLFTPNNPSLQIWHQWQLENRIGKGLNAVISFFEIDILNKREINNILNHDIYISSSQWMTEIIKTYIPAIQVHTVPMGVDSKFFLPTVKHIDEKIPYTFLHIGKLEIRKGHDILCDIFNKAFTKEDNVRLLIAWHSPFISDDEKKKWEIMYRESPLGDKIEFVPRISDLRQLYAESDCCIFPTRAESICLPAIEAMSCNRPVIITNYSGQTAFCNNFNSYLVNIDELESAYDGIWFHGDGQWAKIGDNQIEQFINHMRFCYKCRINLNPEGRRTAEQLDWKNISKQIYEIIK